VGSGGLGGLLRESNMKKLALDAIDLRILCAVQTHGKISKFKLAELVNLSPTPCRVRLDKLTKMGIIKAYRAEIDLDHLLDLTQVIVTVSLKTHKKSDFERFESYINQVEEIIECYATGGGCDYVMTFMSRNLSSFQTLVEHLLSEDIGIDRYFIYIVTKLVKKTPPNLTALLSPNL
jgi:Lrp/AsnC family transcriptional regulator of ectoine degradation